MKRKLSAVLFACLFSLWGVNTSRADNSDFGIALFDLFVARPLGVATTVVGSAVFVTALPLAAVTGSTRETAHTLVVAPGKFTFVRPIGEFTDFSSHADDTASNNRRNHQLATGKIRSTGRTSDQKLAKQSPSNRTCLAKKDPPPGRGNPSLLD